MFLENSTGDIALTFCDNLFFEYFLIPKTTLVSIIKLLLKFLDVMKLSTEFSERKIHRIRNSNNDCLDI